jgi:CHAT domain-containing protein/tetratricopeptide (TPR) repeat protein
LIPDFLRKIFPLVTLIFVAFIAFSQEHAKYSSGEILNKANHCFEKRQYDSAVYLYKKFLSEKGVSLNPKVSDQGNRPGKNMEVQVFLQIGNVYILKGDFVSAESWYQKALNLSGNFSDLKEKIYQNLGSLYYLKEQYEYSILYYQKSWFICSNEPARNSARTVDILISLGTAYSGNKEYQKSLSCFRKAESVLKVSEEKDPVRIAALSINIGEILVKLDAPAKALKRYQTAHELASRSNTSEMNILISSNEGMAECYTRLGQADSAMACMRNCLELIKSAGTDFKHECSRVYLFMGNIEFRQKEWERSINYYNQALSALLPDSVNFSITEPAISIYESDLLDLYKIFEFRGRSRLQSAIHKGLDTFTLSRAYKDFIMALKICDHISKDFGLNASRMTFYESTKSILTGAIESGFFLKGNIGTPDFTILFSLADASKNRMLLEDMEENRSMKLSGVPDSIMETIRGLKDEIVFYSRKYVREDFSTGTSPLSGLNEMQNKVTDLKLKLDSLRKKIDINYPDYPLQTRHEKKEPPSRILQSLKGDEAMLEYFYADSVIYIFLIRNDGASMQRVVLPSTFNNTLKECLHQLKSAEIRNYSSLSRTLYNCLVAPAEPRLNGIRRLILIPDEELSLFPFETLIREDPTASSATNSSSWHYLVRDFEILYHFSAEAWFKDTARSEPLTSSSCYAGFTPVFRNSPGNPGSLNPIPFALKEVKGIAGLFGRGPTHQMVFLDTASTERNFRLNAPGKTHIHIATHSLISENDPMSSALVFSKSKHSFGYQDKDDGLLHLDEISNLRLDASLVVLSACATGEGKVTRTEGVLALTRGFYLAGASNVVYSLWSIPDHLTCDFMLSFYRSCFSGKSYGAALREVKLKMISRPETSLPYMWAGIVLLGK